MTPDFQAAAIRAAETLIGHHVTAAPISPLPILKSQPDTLVVSFAEIAVKFGESRDYIISSFGESQDAVTVVKRIGDRIRSVVIYNQRLPFYMLQRGLARELGHIVMRHDGSKPEDVRYEEAMAFARHLLCPRPLIRLLEENSIRITTEVLGNVTGCYERCLAGIRRMPPVATPPELNRQLKTQFSEYVTNFAAFQPIFAEDDDTRVADFGSYMEGYEE